MADKSLFTNYGSIDPVSVSIVDPNAPSENFNQVAFASQCENISSNIFLIQTNANNLERALKQIGSSSDRPAVRDQIHNIHQKTNHIINLCTQYLGQVSITSRNGSKQHKLQVERLKSDFHEIVQRYGNLQKNVADKIKTTLLQPRTSTSPMSSTADWGSTGDSDKMQLLDEEATKRQVQKAIDLELEMEQALMLEREERISQIEGDILDVNEIFRNLANMVQEQGESINGIEDNIDNALDQVTEGTEMLNKASSYQKKYRTKLCFLVVIIVIIIVIVLLVVYLT